MQKQLTNELQELKTLEMQWREKFDQTEKQLTQFKSMRDNQNSANKTMQDQLQELKSSLLR